ncbi:hypothetical protein OGU21_15365 [Klebsiella oxytoca]|uniref:hypothetical protein n=1 Tax=Klebsiella oxytoca TaxID=571 RepID=UPI000DFF3B80|nr:hypothetical protein [Klebsiella oxytoca]EIY2867888.1 hypothetical protein [Klebsiella oxytoca]EKQ7193143.1 hypothetical protein [Klebsiella oxytoca]MBG2653687.1 hypothetical protein [Klebsiella oxytoca]WBD80982.1 hypothetical protein OGU21_15365 [Klebsiella oxytoca]STR22731.1 Uncharacterised protein [Klebsiella oxytoca]
MMNKTQKMSPITAEMIRALMPCLLISTSALSPASGTFIGATQRVVDVLSLIITKLICKVKSKHLRVKNFSLEITRPETDVNERLGKARLGRVLEKLMALVNYVTPVTL